MPVKAPTTKKLNKRQKVKQEKIDASEQEFLKWRKKSDQWWIDNHGHVESMRTFHRLLIAPTDIEKDKDAVQLSMV